LLPNIKLVVSENVLQNSTYISLIEENKQQLARLEEKNSRLEETVSNYIWKAATVNISELSMEKIEKDGYVCISKAVDTPSKSDFNSTPEFTIPEKFDWPLPDKESDKENTDAYLEYLQGICKDFKQLQVKKSIESPYLNTTVGVTPHRLNGKADLYVMPKSCVRICRNQLAMVLEMKTRDITSNNVAQAIGYVIAANSLFDIDGRPSPVGVLSDFADQWILIWVGNDSKICYAETEVDPQGNIKTLTRETAIHYIRKHFSRYNQLLQDERSKKSEPERADWAFGGFEAGSLKKFRIAEGEDNMRDLLETDEEILLYDMSRRMKNTPVLAAAAEFLPYFS
jgi:hypothetical protein